MQSFIRTNHRSGDRQTNASGVHTIKTVLIVAVVAAVTKDNDDVAIVMLMV